MTNGEEVKAKMLEERKSRTIGRGATVSAVALLLAAVAPTVVMGGSPLEAKLKALLQAAAKALPGWAFVKGTYVFCPTPNSLTKIYDGGYQAYTKRGAVAAVSAILQRKSPQGMVNLIVHYTKGAAHSKALFTWLEKQAGSSKKAKCFKVGKEAVGCVLPVPGGHVGYGYFGRIMVSVEARGEYSETAALKALKAVLEKALPKQPRKGGSKTAK